MKAYYVEGVFITRQSSKGSNRGARGGREQLEPYAKTVWAESPDEALKIATQELKGGQWAQEPKVSDTSESQRMRAMGAPELPGLSATRSRTKTKDKKSRN